MQWRSANAVGCRNEKARTDRDRTGGMVAARKSERTAEDLEGQEHNANIVVGARGTRH